MTSGESFANVKRWLHEIEQNCDVVNRVLGMSMVMSHLLHAFHHCMHFQLLHWRHCLDCVKLHSGNPGTDFLASMKVLNQNLLTLFLRFLCAFIIQLW